MGHGMYVRVSFFGFIVSACFWDLMICWMLSTSVDVHVGYGS